MVYAIVKLLIIICITSNYIFSINAAYYDYVNTSVNIVSLVSDY